MHENQAPRKEDVLLDYIERYGLTELARVFFSRQQKPKAQDAPKNVSKKSVRV